MLGRVACLAAVLFISLTPAWSAESITLVTPVNTIDTVISEVITRTAYQRLGIDVVIKKYPGERALKLADQGTVDGEVQRIGGLSTKYPNLVQVRPPINFIEGGIFVAGAVVTVEGWESLRPFRIGIVRGIKFAEQNTRGMKVFPVKDYANLMVMLDRGRVDVAVSPKINGLYQLRQQGNRSIRHLEPPLARFELFHYLHKKNAALVPRIGAMFERMRMSGELSRLRRRVIEVLLERAEWKLPVCDSDYACFNE